MAPNENDLGFLALLKVSGVCLICLVASKLEGVHAGHPGIAPRKHLSGICAFSSPHRLCWAPKLTFKVYCGSRVSATYTCVTNALAEVEHAAGGMLRGPENLYQNITKSAFASIDNSFPASKGVVRASKSKLEAELVEYKNVTTAVINGLVDKVNALTPVRDQLDPTY